MYIILQRCTSNRMWWKKESLTIKNQTETKICTTEMAELHMSIDREVSVSIIPQVRKLMMYKKEQIKKSGLDQYGNQEEGVDVDIETIIK